MCILRILRNFYYHYTHIIFVRVAGIFLGTGIKKILDEWHLLRGLLEIGFMTSRRFKSILPRLLILIMYGFRASSIRQTFSYKVPRAFHSNLSNIEVKLHRSISTLNYVFIDETKWKTRHSKKTNKVHNKFIIILNLYHIWPLEVMYFSPLIGREPKGFP